MTWQRKHQTYDQIVLIPSITTTTHYGVERTASTDPADFVDAQAVVLDGSSGTQRFKSVWDERDRIARISKMFLITPVPGFTLDVWSEIVWQGRHWSMVEPPKVTTPRMMHVHHWKAMARWKAVDQ